MQGSSALQQRDAPHWLNAQHDSRVDSVDCLFSSRLLSGGIDGSPGPAKDHLVHYAADERLYCILAGKTGDKVESLLLQDMDDEEEAKQAAVATWQALKRSTKCGPRRTVSRNLLHFGTAAPFR